MARRSVEGDGRGASPVREGRAWRDVSGLRSTSPFPGRGRHLSVLTQVMIGMINSATMFATLIIGLIAGPAVSL
jgi:hypothetical protein